MSNIRELPSLSLFFLTPLFSVLRRGASGGLVVIVNVDKYCCDTLVISVEEAPVRVPLSITKGEIQELSSNHEITTRAKSGDVTRNLRIFLRELWAKVVSPIVDFLLPTYPRQSHIWWCPCAEFSLLPLILLRCVGKVSRVSPTSMSRITPRP